MNGRKPAGPARWLALALIVLFVAAEVAAMPGESPTVDEQNHVARGLSYLRTGDLRLKIGHPPLINMLQAWPLLFDPRLHLPLESPAWASANWQEFAVALFWGSGNPALAMLAAARLMMILLGALLLAVLYRLGADVGGPWVGLAALAAAGLDPSLRAHARLATNDLGTVLTLTALVWLWRRWLRRPARPLTLAVGVSLGLAVTSKFTAWLFVPPLLLAALVQWGAPRRWAARLAVAFGAAALTAWAVYAFAWRPYPLADYVQEFLWATTTPRFPYYLLGRAVETQGFYSYFLVTVLVKTPAALLGLAALGLARWLGRAWRAELAFWLPAAFYFGAVSAARVNIGQRHILPAYPVLYVGGALAFVWLWQARGGRRWAAGALAAWLLVNTALIYPRDLTFFNEAAGGPDNGYRVLVDSNLDWGQDLGELVTYVRDHHIPSIYVSYFGSVPIGSFPVKEFPLPALPLPPRPVPDWHPLFPAPGWYAISVTHLVGGASFTDPDTFAYFRHHLPVAILGRTIYVYYVPAEGGTLAACSNPPPTMGLEAVQPIFGAALTRYLEFDCAQGLPLPAGRTWYLLRGEQVGLLKETLTRLGATLEYDQSYNPDPHFAFSLYRLEGAAARAASYAPAPPAAAVFAGRAEYLGQRTLGAAAGGRLQVQTVWRLQAPLPGPTSIFLHLTAPDGFTLAVSDGLNTPVDRWQPGDALIQFHVVEAPAQPPAGLIFQVGLYRLDGARPRYLLPGGADAVTFPLEAGAVH